jgi:hypothetical protein
MYATQPFVLQLAKLIKYIDFMYGSFLLFGALQFFFFLAGHLLVNNSEPPNTPRLTATERIDEAARIQDQDATGPRSCPDMVARSGQRTERTYQMAARDEEEEQETSLPLDFGDSLPPRLTPLADKQFRYTKKPTFRNRHQSKMSSSKKN